jgi:hypothetical protein
MKKSTVLRESVFLIKSIREFDLKTNGSFKNGYEILIEKENLYSKKSLGKIEKNNRLRRPGSGDVDAVASHNNNFNLTLLLSRFLQSLRS